MADQVISAEKVRAILTENLDRVRKASNEYFHMLEKGLGSSQLPIADHAKQFTDPHATQRRFDVRPLRQADQGQ
jgi:hypothetical protein